MKKALLLAVAMLAFAGTGVASASNTNPHGANTAHFTASYDNALGGHWTCNGERIANKDEEECDITDASTFLSSGKAHVKITAQY